MCLTRHVTLHVHGGIRLKGFREQVARGFAHIEKGLDLLFALAEEVYLPLVGERTRDNPNHLIWEYTDTRVLYMHVVHFHC